MTRPLSVTITGWVFVLTGCLGLVYAAFRRAASVGEPFSHFAWAAASGLLALAGGAFSLRGHGWARWALIAWMGAHVGIGALHSAEKALVHALFLAVLAFFLFRPAASAFFRGELRG